MPPLGVRWHADPAGAQDILLLKRSGFDARPCVHMPVRGAGGETKSPKRAGISIVRNRMRTGRLKIVRPKCRELVRELGLYMRDPDKPDEEEPLKKDDHAPDALRYLVVGHDRGRSIPGRQVMVKEDPILLQATRMETEAKRQQDWEASLDDDDPRWTV